MDFLTFLTALLGASSSLAAFEMISRRGNSRRRDEDDESE